MTTEIQAPGHPTLPRRKSCRLVTFGLLLLAIILMQISKVYGYGYDDPDPLVRQLHFLRQQQIDQNNARNLEIFQENLDEMTRNTAEFNTKITAARKQFWAAYPDKPELTQVRTNFDELLRQKDFYFLSLGLYAQNVSEPDVSPYTQQGRDNENAVKGQQLLIHLVENKTGGPLDGGILPQCQPEFNDWLAAVWKRLQDPDKHKWDSLESMAKHLRAMPARMTNALTESQSEYETYVESRTWAEFLAAGREQAGASNPDYYTVMLLAHYQKIPWEAAETDFISLIRLMGKDAIQQAALKVHSTPKDTNGDFTDIHSLGLWPYQYSSPAYEGGMDMATLVPPGFVPIAGDNPLVALIALASKDSDKSYLLELLARSYPRPVRAVENPKAWDWQYAAYAWNGWVNAFGEAAVLQAAEQLRTAAKRQLDGNVAKPQSIGALRGDPYKAFQDILVRGNPRSYVRAILAFNQHLTNTAAIDAEYQKLVSAHGEKAVADAAQQMASRSGSSANQWPAAERSSDFHMLVGVLNGSLTLSAPDSITPSDLVSNPEYAVWAKFSTGTVVTTASKSWVEMNGRIYPGSTGGTILFQTRKIFSVDKDDVVVLLSERHYFPPGSRTDSGQGAFSYTSEPHDIHYPAQTSKGRRTQAIAESSTGTLNLLGRTIQCQISQQILGNGKLSTWTSDTVPGGLVQKITVTSGQPGASAGSAQYFVDATIAITPIEKLDDLTRLPALTFPEHIGSLALDKLSQQQTDIPVGTTVASVPNVSNLSAEHFTIPTETIIELRLKDSIAMNDVGTDHEFHAQTLRPIYLAGQVVIPQNTDVFLKAIQQTVTNRPEVVNVIILIDHFILKDKKIDAAGQTYPIRASAEPAKSALGFTLNINGKKFGAQSHPNSLLPSARELAPPGRNLIFHLTQPLTIP